MKKNMKKKGFTLIELIVVIAILGILAAVLIPKFGGFQDKARATQAITDAKQIATALDSLYAEKGVYPCADGGTETDVTIKMVDDLSGVTTISSTTCVLIMSDNGAFTYGVLNGDKWYVAGREATGDAVGKVKAITTTFDAAPDKDQDFD